MTRITPKTAVALFATAALFTLLTFSAIPALAHHLFPDVSAASVHHDNVTRANDEGIFEGDTDGNFNPAEPIRRDQAASVAVRTLDAADDHAAETVADATTYDLSVDGPYPGATQLTEGSNSTSTWAGDEGADLHESWVECPDGTVAVGGGFSRADEGTAAFRGLQVVQSAPRDTSATVIDGDPDGSVIATGWKVEGFNNGTTDLIVRPWVVCVDLRTE